MIKKIFIEIIQWTWCFLQNILGFCVMKYYKGEKHSYTIDGKQVVAYHSTKISGGSVSLGKFIILHKVHWDDEETIRHEYGHQLQSLLLGPLYLLVIGIPSGLWCWFGQDWINQLRKKKNKEPLDYYWLYCESWANKLGKVHIEN